MAEKKDTISSVFKIVGYVGAAIAGLGAVGLNARKTALEANSMKTKEPEVIDVQPEETKPADQ